MRASRSGRFCAKTVRRDQDQNAEEDAYQAASAIGTGTQHKRKFDFWFTCVVPFLKITHSRLPGSIEVNSRSVRGAVRGVTARGSDLLSG